MKTQSYKPVAIIIFVTLLCTFQYKRLSFSNTIDHEKRYFEQKKTGAYGDALSSLSMLVKSSRDPHRIETNLFRIYELTEQVNLLPEAISVLTDLKQHKTVKQHCLLMDRLNSMLNMYYLKTGELIKAKQLSKTLGFLSFRVSGPYPNNSINDFQKSNWPELHTNILGSTENNKQVQYFFPVHPGPGGDIDLKKLFPSVTDKYFYLYRNITVKTAGIYTFGLGKNGFTDIWIDNKKIFTNRVRHGFFHNQYIIKVYLSSGTHRILIKSGNTNNKLRFSLQLSNPYGGKIPDAVGDSNINNPGSVRVQSTQYFPALQHYFSNRPGSAPALFTMGYLVHMSQLNNETGRTAYNIFSKISADNYYYSIANYYIARSMSDPTLKEIFLKRARDKDRNNIEILFELGRLKLHHGYLYQGYKFIKKISQLNRNSPLKKILLVHFYQKKGWDFKAIEQCNDLLNTNWSDNANRLLYSIYLKKHDYTSAADHALAVYKKNNMDYYTVKILTHCFFQTGSYSKAITHLAKSIPCFPNSVELRLDLQDCIEKKYGINKSLPYITAAQHISPYNTRTLFILGEKYNLLGKKDLAVYYIRTALLLDHDNFRLRQYLNFLTGENDLLKKYLSQKPVYELAEQAEQYSNEAAVILSKEKIISVNSDGSYTTLFRKRIKVNSDDALNDFSYMTITYDPAVEDIEQIQCLLIDKNRKTPITRTYKQSLSDPDEKLYYNLEQLILPVDSLRPGMIIDFSYRISNSAGNIYNNYFDQKFFPCGLYRTIYSNNVLLHPAGLKLYCYTRGIDKKKISVTKNKNSLTYRLQMSDLSPVKQENAMPEIRSFIPTLYFTSCKDWNELYTWYRSYLVNKIVMNEEMKQALRQLVQKDDTQEQMVDKIYSHVTGTIRYVGFELGIGGIKPRRSDMTYTSKMGDCKDIALVLVAFLKEAGIDARLALVNTRDNGTINYRVPVISNFNHALCYIKSRNPFFIDGTMKDCGYRELPDSDRDIKAMVIGEDSYAFINTGSPLYYKNTVRSSNILTIDENGSATIQRQIIKTGSYASIARREAQNYTKKNRSLSQYWNNQFTGAGIKDLVIVNDKINQPLVYKYTVIIPDYSSRTKKDLIIPAFLTGSDYFSSYCRIPQREHPINLASTGTSIVTIKYIIPENYTVSYLPRSTQFTNNKFSAWFRYTLNNNTLQVKSVITINSYIINTEDYQEFRKFALFVNMNEIKKIILSKKQ